MLADQLEGPSERKSVVAEPKKDLTESKSPTKIKKLADLKAIKKNKDEESSARKTLPNGVDQSQYLVQLKDMKKKNLRESHNPVKNKLRAIFEDSQTFLDVMLLIVVFNIIILCYDHHGIDEDSWKAILVLDYICTVLFTVELLIRIYSFGPRAFWRDSFERLDTIIILLNFIELVYELVDGHYSLARRSDTEGVKGLKILRIFRFFISKKVWRDASSLFIEMFIAIYKVKEYIVTVVVFLIVTAMMGRELMAYRVRFNDNGEIDL